MMGRYQKGRMAEYSAAAYLMVKGYSILKIRYKTHVGEIDILARKGQCLVGVEVKYRRTYEDGAYAIHPKSQSRIRRAMDYYRMENAKESDTILYEERIDALIISQNLLIKHIKNAF